MNRTNREFQNGDLVVFSRTTKRGEELFQAYLGKSPFRITGKVRKTGSQYAVAIVDRNEKPVLPDGEGLWDHTFFTFAPVMAGVQRVW